MVEFFQNINIQDVWLTIVAFLGLDVSTIIGLIIAWARGKIKHGMEIEKVKKESRAEMQVVKDECMNVLGKVEITIKELKNSIDDAIKTSEAKEKAEIEANSIKLTATLNEAKAKAVNLTEELEKL